MDPTIAGHHSIPDRVQALTRLRLLGFTLIFSALGIGFWFLIALLKARPGTTEHNVALLILGASIAALIAGIALGLLTTRRFKALHAEATTRGLKADAVEWSDAGLKVDKGRAMAYVSGGCILCSAPRASWRGVVTQMHSGTAGFGLAGYAASSVRYAREKKKYGWPEGAKALVVNAPLCEDCRVRFPRWTLLALLVGVAASLAVLFLAKAGPGAAGRILHLALLLLPGSIGAALAVAGLVVRDVPVPVKTKRWRERIEAEVPSQRDLTTTP